MKPKFLSPLLVASVSLCFAGVHAAEVTSIASGFWDSAATWSNAATAAAGNSYIVTSGRTVDSIQTTGNGETLTFPGDSITVQSGGILRSRHNSGGGNNTHSENFKSVKLENGASFYSYNTGAGNVIRNFSNDFVLAASGAVNMGIRSDNTGGYDNKFRLNGILSGGADINVTGPLYGQAGERRTLFVNKENNPFTGNWFVEGTDTTDNARRLYLTAEKPGALGSGAVTLKTRAQLRVTSAGNINQLAGVTLTTSTSNLELQGVLWTNPAAFLANNGGTVSLADGTSSIGNLSGTGGSIQGNGLVTNLTVNQTTDGVYGGALTQTTGNSLSLTKAGAGTLTLAGANTYAGPTTVTAGTLGVTGSLPVAGAVTLSGGNLSLGTGTTALGNVTTGSLTQTSGNVLLDVSATGADHLTVTGGYQYSSGNIVVRFEEQPALGSPYTLVTYGGALSSHPVVTYAGASRINGTVDYGTGTNSAITVTFAGGIANLVWTGTGGSTWNVNSTQNWSNSSTPDKFFQLDNVTFDDTGSGGTVNLTETVTPGAVTFNNSSKSYTFSGTGLIGGTAALTKSGTGSVTLATNNTNTGATIINEGTLRLGNGGTSGSLGAGAVTNNGTLAFNRSDVFTFANVVGGTGSVEQAGTGTTILTGANDWSGGTTVTAGTLQIGNGAAIGTLGTGAIVNNGTLAFNRSGTVTLATGMTGTGGLTQMGPGTLLVSADQAYSGATLISAGRLQLGTGGATGNIAATSSITNNGELAVNLEGDLNFTQVVSGTGALTQAGPGVLRLTAANTYTGETRVEQGKILLDAGSDIPVGGRVAFTGGDAILDLTTKSLSLGGLRRESTTTGVGQIVGTQPLTVAGGDLVVGTTAAGSATLNLAGVPSLAYNLPGNTIAVGARAAVDGAGGTLILPPATSLTAAAFNVQSNNSSTSANTTTIASGTVVLGATTTLNANEIRVATSGRDNGSIRYAAGTSNPTLTIRGTDGSGRANVTLGTHSTVYGVNNSGVIDLTTDVTGDSTLDARVGTMRIGQYSRGNAHVQTNAFLMGKGTFDATLVELGNIANNNGDNGTQNSTFTLGGGSATIATLNFGTRAQGVLNATFNLNAGGTLAAQTITAGTGTGNRNLNWNSGTIRNVTDQDLSIGGVKLNVPLTGTHALAISPGHTATLATGSTLALNYDSSTLAAGTVTVDGSLVLDATAALVVQDVAASPVALPEGTKITLINYTGGSLTGTFSGIPDGSLVQIGSQAFTMNYHDTLGGTGLGVTLSVYTDPFPAWIDRFPALTDPAQKAKDADPDGDGLNNLAEFLLDGDPTNSAPSGKVVTKIATVGAEFALTLTLPMLDGAAVSPNEPTGGQRVLSKDNKKYTIQASSDLAVWTLDVVEVVPALSAGMPTPLSNGFSYRTFRIAGPTSDRPKAFLRVKAGE